MFPSVVGSGRRERTSEKPSLFLQVYMEVLETAASLWAGFRKQIWVGYVEAPAPTALGVHQSHLKDF